jgi:hypothetical protein
MAAKKAHWKPAKRTATKTPRKPAAKKAPKVAKRRTAKRRARPAARKVAKRAAKRRGAKRAVRTVGYCCDGPVEHYYPPNKRGSDDACVVPGCSGRLP